MKKVIICLFFVIAQAGSIYAQKELPEASVDIPIVRQIDKPPAEEWSNEDLRQLATRYSAIGDRIVNFSQSQLALLKEINPDLIVMKYLSVTTIHGKGRANRALKRIPEAALYNSDGVAQHPLWNQRGKGVVFDPGHPKWREHLIQEVKKIIDQGYSGTMFDESLMVNDLPDYFAGINPRTGKIYKSQDFRDDVYENIVAIREEVGDDIIMISNSVANGEKYFKKNGYKFLKVVDGVVAEGFRGPFRWKNDRFFDESRWKDNIEMLRDVERRGKFLIANVKYEKNHWESLSEQRQKEINQFHVLSFLLGKGKRSAMSLNVHDKKRFSGSYRLFDPITETQLGKPLGDYYKNGGVYQREFQLVKVLVNPTKKSVTVNLKKQNLFLDEKPVTKITLKPHTGVLLQK